MAEQTAHDESMATPIATSAQDRIPLKLQQSVIGLLFIINSLIIDYFFKGSDSLAAASAMIGSLLLMIPILIRAGKDILSAQLTINELVAIAVLAAFTLQEYKIAGVVAFFMLIGEFIETRTAEGARASIESLIKLTPTKARLILEGSEKEVAVHELKVGDRIRIRPGDNIPADGKVVSGEASINQANITGESIPVDKKTGEEVFAGTVNLTGMLEVEVTRAGQDTTLGKVRNLILAAEKTRLPIMRIIDQYIGYYTPLVLVIAAMVWVFTEEPLRVISVLVMACPAAFILASPTAMVASLSAAARLGILIKNVGDLESAAKLNALVFDKTGTLTYGSLAVSRLSPVDGVTPAELLRTAASAEKFSNHPTAKALQFLAGEAELNLPDPANFKEFAGQGIQAQVDGRQILAGRSSWLKEQGLPESIDADLPEEEKEGASLMFIAADGRLLGWIALQDRVRDESRESLSLLKDCGIRRIAMVSGDRRPVAEKVAAEIGCEEVAAECLPQDKVEFVRAMRDKGYRTAVVGDGVNDAPALAAGDIGIAMGAAGSEVAINTATIALMNNDLRRIPFLVQLSRSTRAIINQNFLFGILFIFVGVTFAAFGYINPIVAALLYNFGSLVVIFNSARLVRQGEHLEPFINQNQDTSEAAAVESTPASA
jgi:Cd2+/Zn2+-exporting ATPase